MVSHSEWLSWLLRVDYQSKRHVPSALYRASTKNFLSSEFIGVSKIETDVSAKTVIVEADESVAPQMMLKKLEKVRERSEMSGGRNWCSLVSD
jgi:hypothetical protein